MPQPAEQPSASEHPARWKFDYPIYHAETRAQWRAWLEANHDTDRGVWLCSWRRPPVGRGARTRTRWRRRSASAGSTRRSTCSTTTGHSSS